MNGWKARFLGSAAWLPMFAPETGEGAISISQAAGLLSAEPPKDEENAPETVETPPAPAQAEESAPVEGEEGARPEEAPSAETKTEPDPAVPPIEPPSSMTAEEKERFKSLPREAQEFLTRRERDQTNALRQKQDELANQRKALEAEAERLKAAPAHPQVSLMWAELARDFPDVKTAEDLANLAKTDIARASEFKVRYDAALGAQSQINQLQIADIQRRYAEHIQNAEKALVEHFPAWKDQAVGRKEIGEIFSYLQSQGIPEAQLRGDPANLVPGLTDPKLFDVARKAMLYDRAQAAAKAVEPKVKALPPVVTPKSTPKADPKAEELETLNRRLGQTGSIKDAAALLRAMRH